MSPLSNSLFIPKNYHKWINKKVYKDALTKNGSEAGFAIKWIKK